jgi:dolichyl-diphosphooligosaccharide--protein glycosyltransferase
VRTSSPWIAFGLFALAFGIRALTAPRMLAGGVVHLRGADGWYHLRRILYSIENFPAALTTDPYVAWPTGAKPIWPPFFDWVLALLHWPVAQLGGHAAVERAVLWVPPLLGAATVVAAWALARRHLGGGPALVAGLLLAISGGHFAFSQVGALDHHVAVSLVSTLLLAACLRVLAGEPLAGRLALLVTGLLALNLLVWPGAVAYAGLALAGLGLHAFAACDAAAAVERLRRLALAAAAAGILLAPFCLPADWPQWSAWSPVVLSGFQPWLFASASATALGGWLAARRGGSIPVRLAAGAAVAAAVLAASALAWPDLAAGAGDAWRWLAKREEFQSSVIESQPLFSVQGRVSASMAHRQLSWLVYAFPLAWLAGLADARRRERPAALRFLLAWSLALCALTLMQKRFLDTFSVAFSLQLAWGLGWLASALRARLPAPSAQRLALAGLAALVLVALAPMALAYAEHARNLGRWLRGEPLGVMRFTARDLILHDVAVWLRDHTPETSGWLDPGARPEYGVIAPWWAGHVIQYVARRPTVTDNFGDDVGERGFALEREFWTLPEPAAYQMLDELGVRYVLVRLGDPRHEVWPPESVYRSLLARDGSFQRGAPGEDEAVIPAFSRLRLVFESQRLFEQTPDQPPLYKVYEFVPGARIEGRAREGTGIDLELALHTNRGRGFVYRARTRAGAGDRYAITVPYATTGAPPAVTTTGIYQLSCESRERGRLEVTEQDVRAGRTIAGPDLCLGDRTQ